MVASLSKRLDSKQTSLQAFTHTNKISYRGVSSMCLPGRHVSGHIFSIFDDIQESASQQYSNDFLFPYR